MTVIKHRAVLVVDLRSDWSILVSIILLKLAITNQLIIIPTSMDNVMGNRGFGVSDQVRHKPSCPATNI